MDSRLPLMISARRARCAVVVLADLDSLGALGVLGGKSKELGSPLAT